jgi:hypothetical protein
VVPVPGDPGVRRRVLQLRLGGADYEAIAKAVPEIEDAGHAARECEQAQEQLALLTEWEAGKRASLEHMRLDLLERHVMAVLQNAAAAGSDPQLVLGAVDRVLKISEARRGLDVLLPEAGDSDDPLAKAMRAIQLKLVPPG